MSVLVFEGYLGWIARVHSPSTRFPFFSGHSCTLGPEFLLRHLSPLGHNNLRLPQLPGVSVLFRLPKHSVQSISNNRLPKRGTRRTLVTR